MHLCIKKQQMREGLMKNELKSTNVCGLLMKVLLMEEKRIIYDRKLLTHLYWCNNLRFSQMNKDDGTFV